MQFRFPIITTWLGTVALEENRTEEDIMGLLKFAFYDHHTLSLVLVQLGIILPSRLKSLCVKVFLKPLRDFLPPQPADKGTTIAARRVAFTNGRTFISLLSPKFKECLPSLPAWQTAF